MARMVFGQNWMHLPPVAGGNDGQAEVKGTQYRGGRSGPPSPQYPGGPNERSSAPLAALRPAGTAASAIGMRQRNQDSASFRVKTAAGDSQPPAALATAPRPGQSRQYVTQQPEHDPSAQNGRGPYSQAALEMPDPGAFLFRQNPDTTSYLSKRNQRRANGEAAQALPDARRRLFPQHSDPTPYLSKGSQRRRNQEAALEMPDPDQYSLPQKRGQAPPPVRQQMPKPAWQPMPAPVWQQMPAPQQTRPPAAQQTARYNGRPPAAVPPGVHPNTLRMSFEPTRPSLAPATAPLSPSRTQPAAALRTPKPNIRTGPRVEKVDDTFAFKLQVKAMEQQLRGMYKTRKGFFSLPLSSDDKEHNARISNCLTVLREHMKGNMNYIIYEADGKPGALMSLSLPPEQDGVSTGVKIHGLMSLPGTKGLGLKAVRQAVQISKDAGRKGRVDLQYLQFSNAHKFYTDLGFSGNGAWNENDMYLSPYDADELLAGRRRARTN